MKQKERFAIFNKIAIDYCQKLCLIMLGICTLALPANAQGPDARTLKGVVVTTQGETMLGATVMVEGTTNGVVTDMDGNFTISVPANAKTLVVKMIGMKQKNVPITAATDYRIILEDEIYELGEVVAVGYGNVRKKDLSGAIANISEDKFNQGVVTSPEQLIKGQISGLVITRPGGNPNAESTIRLRGTTSLMGGNGPLIVIDGVPDASLSSVSPQDIESISVLKDASAAAIYGARSANGVIMVTTKRGKAGKTSISYDGYFAVEKLGNNLEMLSADEWRQWVKENNVENAIDFGGDTNWVDEIYRTGYSQNHNISLMGGTDNSTYRASFNFLDQKGIVENNDLQRLNANIAFDQKALDGKLRVMMNANATIDDYNEVPTPNVFAYALNLNPTIPVYDQDGSFKEVAGYEYYNPVAMLKQMKSDGKRNHFMGRMQVEYSFLDMFTAAVNGSVTHKNSTTGYFESRESRSAEATKGFARRTSNEEYSNLLEAMLTFDKTFGKHRVNAVGGYSYQDLTREYFMARNRNFSTDVFEYNNLGAGNNLLPTDVSSNKNSSKLISFYGRANYTFADKYIFTGTVRRDGSSKFGANNKWGVFPSASVAWRITEEAFMEGFSFIDDLKMRVSYGITGNQDIDPYKSVPLYGSSGFYYQGGDFYTQYAPNQNANPNLKWEQTAQFNLGFDFFLFNSRVRGTFDYYNKQTSNLLYNYPVPTPPYQYGTMMANVGDVENKGVEIGIETTVIRNNDFTWDLGFNFAKNKNKLKSLSNDEFQLDVVYTGEWSLNGLQETPQILKPGYPLGTFFGARYTGKDEEGIFQYKDVNGDGEFVYADDREVIGCAQPDFTINMTNTFNYKNWYLSFLLRGVFGNDIANSTRLYLDDVNRLPGSNVLKTALDKAPQKMVYSSYYIEDGSFVRLDYLTLGYNFKLKTSKIQNLRLTATANNLFVITGYSGIDPEVNVEFSDMVFGIDARNYYPKTRSFSLGLNVSF